MVDNTEIKIGVEFDKTQYSEAYKIYLSRSDLIIKELDNGNFVLEYIQIPLSTLKEDKRAEINQARDAAEQGGFEYLGKMFDSDQVSCQRISCAAQAMALAPEGSTITWTCQDNSTIDLTASELVGLVVALAQWSNTCHQKATILKEQIELAETEEELEKILWNTED